MKWRVGRGALPVLALAMLVGGRPRCRAGTAANSAAARVRGVPDLREHRDLRRSDLQRRPAAASWPPSGLVMDNANGAAAVAARLRTPGRLRRRAQAYCASLVVQGRRGLAAADQPRDWHHRAASPGPRQSPGRLCPVAGPGGVPFPDPAGPLGFWTSSARAPRAHPLPARLQRRTLAPHVRGRSRTVGPLRARSAVLRNKPACLAVTVTSAWTSSRRR